MAKHRSLQQINQKLDRDSEILQTTLGSLLQQRSPLSVLEIGCGAGRALMELAWQFRSEPVVFHAINVAAGEPLHSQNDLLETARRYGLAEERELRALALPQLAFYDATQLRFPDDSLDLIYLSSVMRFIERKAEFLEEIYRALVPGGVALVRVSSSGWDYPPEPVGEPLLTELPSRWVLRHAGELVPLDAYLSLFRGDGFDVEFINRPACVMRIRKRASGRVSFGLDYEPTLSRPMRELPFGDAASGDAERGFRSVYAVRAPEFRRLRDGGFLAGAEPERSSRGDSERVAKLEKNRELLALYRPGLRLKIKGRCAEDRVLRAVKIRLNQDEDSAEHMEGRLEWVDAEAGAIGLLGRSVLVAKTEPIQGPEGALALSEVSPGMLVKVKGHRSAEGFRADRVKIRETPAIFVDEIQGAIEAVDAANGRLVVAGFAVAIGEETKLDAP